MNGGGFLEKTAQGTMNPSVWIDHILACQPPCVWHAGWRKPGLAPLHYPSLLSLPSSWAVWNNGPGLWKLEDGKERRTNILLVQYQETFQILYLLGPTIKNRGFASKLLKSGFTIYWIWDNGQLPSLLWTSVSFYKIELISACTF